MLLLVCWCLCCVGTVWEHWACVRVLMLFGGGRRYSPHLFFIISLCLSLFLFCMVALCCSFHSLTNSSVGLLFSTVLLVEFIIALSCNAILKSVNKVSSDNFLQHGFMFFYSYELHHRIDDVDLVSGVSYWILYLEDFCDSFEVNLH